VAVAKSLSDEYTPAFWYDWFVSLPVWLTPTFSLLAVSRTYITIWSRARMRDVIILFLTLISGLMLSLGLALLVYPNNQIQKLLLVTLSIFAIGHPAIIALRVFYRVIEELVGWSRSKDAAKFDGRRILVYGTGARCLLWLRDLSSNKSEQDTGRTIVGLVDDDTSLHSRWVYGYPVLGGGQDLPGLIARHHITGIVVTADLKAESREAVIELARQQEIELSEWTSSERVLIPQPLSVDSRSGIESKMTA